MQYRCVERICGKVSGKRQDTSCVQGLSITVRRRVIDDLTGLQGMYHEVHNELEPTPTEVAALIGNWIYERAGGPIPPAEATVKGQEQASTDGGVSKL